MMDNQEYAEIMIETQEYAELWSLDECNAASAYDGWINDRMQCAGHHHHQHYYPHHHCRRRHYPHHNCRRDHCQVVIAIFIINHQSNDAVHSSLNLNLNALCEYTLHSSEWILAKSAILAVSTICHKGWCATFIFKDCSF